jgi:AmiR/NasT family two-component response regulator
MQDGMTFRSLEEARTTVARLLTVTRASYERRAQLEHALESRVTIEQAKGILAERFGLSVDEAFDVLRRAARSNRLKLHAVAADVVASRETPQAVASVAERGRTRREHV